MIRQRVRRNLDADLLQGCEELLRIADGGDGMHARALECVQRSRLAADQRNCLRETRARLDGRRNRRKRARGAVAPGHDAQVRLREAAHWFAQWTSREHPAVADTATATAGC